METNLGFKSLHCNNVSEYIDFYSNNLDNKTPFVWKNEHVKLEKRS